MPAHDDDPQARPRQPSASPWGNRPSGPPVQPAPPPRQQPAPPRGRSFSWQSAAFAVLILGSIGVQAYQELSKPEAWAYWKDLYVSPSMTAKRVDVDLGRSGHNRPALAISGNIGPATASWFRDRLDEAHLAPGDLVLLSSPGGNLGQAMIMGEVIRAHGLVTAVGTPGSNGKVQPSYCASACVMAYAGGTPRVDVAGSRLGVHRFTSPNPEADPVASAQRTMGFVLSYMTKMGVASSVVEAMSATDKIHWLGASEAAAMNLTTEPAGKS